MKILIGGSSGLIGSALCQYLTKSSYEVVRLVRREPATGEIYWDPAEGMLDPEAIEGFDAVIHLGGAGIGDKRWSGKRKQQIVSSRIDSTRLLAMTLATLENPPQLYINSSAIGFYGDQGDTILTEADSPTSSLHLGFLTQLCNQWETATAPAAQAGIRTVLLRLAVVIHKDALFLKRQLPLFRLGLGGRLGKANRWISWIALADVVRSVTWLLSSDSDPAKNNAALHDISGPVNLCSPEPVQNSEFIKTMGQILRRPTFLPVPKFLPSLILSKELVDSLTESTRVMPQVLLDNGYQFVRPELEPVLRLALEKQTQPK